MIKDFLLNDCLLFKNMTDDNIKSLSNCFKMNIKTYKKNDYIVKMDDDIEYIHIIYSGTCIIEEEDYWGNRSIMDVVLRNQVFGISYAYANIKKYPVSLVAKEKTKVIIIPVSKVFSPCSKHCVHHNTLIKNAVEVLAIKNISLMEKLEHISKRTTREKIISFLSIVC